MLSLQCATRRSWLTFQKLFALMGAVLEAGPQHQKRMFQSESKPLHEKGGAQNSTCNSRCSVDLPA